MKTKDLFRGAMVAVCAAMMLVAMSCNLISGNNPVTPPSGSNDSTSTSDASMKVTTWYSFPTNEDMLDLFYIKVEYLDGDGKMQTVTLNDDAWVVQVESKKLPAKLGMRVNITMKGTADLTKYQSVNINYTVSAISRLFDAQGKKTGDDHKHIVDVELELAPNKVSQWVEEYKKNPVEFWYEYDANGNYKQTK